MKLYPDTRTVQSVHQLADAVRHTATRHWAIMEMCGRQTHNILRSNIDLLLKKEVTILHGPGCPVCVTPIELIDKAIHIASRPEVIFCAYGDLLRVPGTYSNLLSVKMEGGDVRIVYSPLDALKIAAGNLHREVVFFAAGFEATAPSNAMAIIQARQDEVKNFSMLVSHVLGRPALEAMAKSASIKVDGFLFAGHFSAAMGYDDFDHVARNHKKPIVITGTEPLDILQGILMCVKQLENKQVEVINLLPEDVQRKGNAAARDLCKMVFRPVDHNWRGIGMIPLSGWGLSEEYAQFDAEKKFRSNPNPSQDSTECISGKILQGRHKPPHCPLFGTRCTPDHPFGATMVSSEGACAAYFHYRRNG